MILAGHSLDGIGPAVVIFEAESEEEARCFMEGGVAGASGIYLYWTIPIIRA